MIDDMQARRKLYDKLEKHLPKKEFTILTGARQAGKSTLMRQLQEQCKRDNTPNIFLNFENKSVLNHLNENPLNLLNYLPDISERIVVFIDEVQYLDDASNFLKLLYDEHADKIKIIATGSSAFYINSGFKDSLAGRKRIFHLNTCSFDEYLQLSGKTDLLKEFERIIKKPGAKSTSITYLQNEWEKYMIYGGYPAIITEPDKKEKIEGLKEIRDSFVKRDILESGVTNEAAFFNLFRLLAAQSGNLVNVNEISSTLKIMRETVNNYFTILEKCFHVKLVKPFYRNLRKELTKMPKVFLMDTGLRNCLLNNFQPMNQRVDKGELWENTVYRILLDEYGEEEIRYWRTVDGKEVDFVLPEIEEPKALEVKIDNNRLKTTKYKKFIETYSEIPFSFAWMYPFDEAFFERMEKW